MSNPNIEANIGYDSGGCYVEWFRLSDEKTARWYGTRQECELKAAGPAPSHGWHPLRNMRADEFDLACERRYD